MYLNRKKTLLLAFILYYLKKKKTTVRRYWVHPLVEQRNLKGAFSTLYSDLREDGKKFFNYFRMSPGTFDELYGKLKDSLTHKYVVREPVAPLERLMVTLRYLASGNSFTDLHYSYRLGRSTISAIVQEVCYKIWRLLKGEFLQTPKKERWKEIVEGFKNRANFPNCLGAVDGKHIRIIKPIKSGSACYNYKNFFSMVLLAICDSDYRFLYVDVGAYGKFSDSTIFKLSPFYKQLHSEKLGIPGNTNLPGTNGPAVPPAFVADEAFALTNHILRPYGRKNLTYKKKIFNYRLTRARRYIECSFGILSNKWRIFHRPLDVGFRQAKRIVQACVVLHNMVRERDGYQFEDTLTIHGLEDRKSTPGKAENSGNNIRDTFANYFCNEGKVPWQDSKI